MGFIQILMKLVISLPFQFRTSKLINFFFFYRFFSSFFKKKIYVNLVSLPRGSIQQKAPHAEISLLQQDFSPVRLSHEI